MNLLVCKVRICQTGEHLANLQARSARRLIVLHTLCAWALSSWKMKNFPEILSMAGISCC